MSLPSGKIIKVNFCLQILNSIIRVVLICDLFWKNQFRGLESNVKSSYSLHHTTHMQISFWITSIQIVSCLIKGSIAVHVSCQKRIYISRISGSFRDAAISRISFLLIMLPTLLPFNKKMGSQLFLSMRTRRIQSLDK